MTSPENPPAKRFTVDEILETIFEGRTTEPKLHPFERILKRFSSRPVQAREYIVRLNTLREATNKLYTRGMAPDDISFLIDLVTNTVVRRINALARDHRIKKSHGEKTSAVNVEDYVVSAAYYLGVLPIRPTFPLGPDLRSMHLVRTEISRSLQEHMENIPDSFVVHPRPQRMSRPPEIKPRRG